MVSIIRFREASNKDSNPDKIEIGNSNRLSKSPHSSNAFNTPFHNALDIELEMWTGCVKEISKIVQNQMKISKDIFSDTFERRKDISISSFHHFLLVTRILFRTEIKAVRKIAYGIR